MKKEKRRVVKQARGPIAKKIRDLKEDWVVEVEIENKKRKTKRCRNIDINEHLLKIEGDCSYKWCLKVR